MKFQIKRFADPSAPDFEALLPEWEALDAQMSPRSPHTSPIWCRLWWQYLRRRTISSRDEFFLHTVRDELGHLIAVAPLMITHKPALGPLRLRLLQFIGADPSMTEVRGLVCRIENQDEVISKPHRIFHCVFERVGLIFMARVTRPRTLNQLS